MSDQDEGLKRTLDEAEWVWLKGHAERDAVIVVSRRLDLLDVAQQIANDEALLIENWVNQGLIGKPTKEEMDMWDKEPGKKFLSVIVQPYVVVQEILLQ